MRKLTSNNDILILMKNQALKEKLLETLKQDISIKKDITLESLYKLFDTEDKGYITSWWEVVVPQIQIFESQQLC